MGFLTHLKSKYEVYRLEQRYTRREKRTHFVSGAQYVDGEYVYPSTLTSETTASSTMPRPMTAPNKTRPRMEGEEDVPSMPPRTTTSRSGPTGTGAWTSASFTATSTPSTTTTAENTPQHSPVSESQSSSSVAGTQDGDGDVWGRLPSRETRTERKEMKRGFSWRKA